jgi:hypothetical protein
MILSFNHIKTVLLLFLFAGLGQLKAQKTIPNGNYRVDYMMDIYTYVFSSDSVLTVIHGTDTSKAIFKTDTLQNPMHIDFSFVDSMGEELYVVLAIYENLEPGKIRIKYNGNLIERPTSMKPTSETDTIHLIRIDY